MLRDLLLHTNIYPSMLNQIPCQIRTVFIIDPKKVIRLTLSYPAAMDSSLSMLSILVLSQLVMVIHEACFVCLSLHVCPRIVSFPSGSTARVLIHLSFVICRRLYEGSSYPLALVASKWPAMQQCERRLADLSAARKEARQRSRGASAWSQ